MQLDVLNRTTILFACMKFFLRIKLFRAAILFIGQNKRMQSAPINIIFLFMASFGLQDNKNHTKKRAMNQPLLDVGIMAIGLIS